MQVASKNNKIMYVVIFFDKIRQKIIMTCIEKYWLDKSCQFLYNFSNQKFRGKLWTNKKTKKG